jgi:hypothetical protein
MKNISYKMSEMFATGSIWTDPCHPSSLFLPFGQGIRTINKVMNFFISE